MWYLEILIELCVSIQLYRYFYSIFSAYRYKHNRYVSIQSIDTLRRIINHYFALGIVVVDQFFVTGHNAIYKPIPILSLKQLFTSKETLFSISQLQLVRNPIFSFVNLSHGFEAFRDGLLRHSQWFCQFFLRLAQVFSK